MLTRETRQIGYADAKARSTHYTISYHINRKVDMEPRPVIEWEQSNHSENVYFLRVHDNKDDDMGITIIRRGDFWDAKEDYWSDYGHRMASGATMEEAKKAAEKYYFNQQYGCE